MSDAIDTIISNGPFAFQGSSAGWQQRTKAGWPAPATPLWSHRSGDQLLVPIFHLSFQALCSFRNLARPGCTGTSGLALMP